MAKFDFSGYATRNDVKCSDGRVIVRDAFKHNDGSSVPLVWQHLHNDPSNILGHAQLENREDGVYAYCSFNDTESAAQAKELVKHGDIKAMSIYANQLKQQGDHVLHGAIREVSLVLSGANPGAFIDNLSFQHSDGSVDIDDTEAVIYSGLDFELKHSDKNIEKEEKGDNTLEEIMHEDSIQDIFNAMSEDQKNVVYAMVAMALEGSPDGAMAQSDEEGDYYMKNNVFEGDMQEEKGTLSHSDIKEIFDDAQRIGSLKESFMMHAQSYGIEDIDILFPDARTVTSSPTFIKRETGWVQGVISGTKHTPFSRIKSTAADITAEEARALGYVKGNLKKEEVIKLLKRVTNPTTLYKKQKLDRDDIIDITDLDVVAWLKSEMRMMLDEEIARAVLVGDGREADSQDKINEENIRPIYKDDDMYAHKVEIASTATTADLVESIVRSRKHYKGTGVPTFYTTTDVLTDMLLLKDGMERRLYNSEAELASALRVSKIVEVPVMENLSRVSGDNTLNLIGLIVNLNDYNMGADRGGEVSMFDDFDIDYNQYKYLMETRCSGALIQPKSALVIEQIAVAG